MHLFRTAATSEETRRSALVWQAKCLRTVGRTTEAQKILEVAFDEEPYSPMGNLEQAHLEIAKREFEAAIKRLSAVLEREPYRHEARFALARALVQRDLLKAGMAKSPECPRVG